MSDEQEGGGAGKLIGCGIVVALVLVLGCPLGIIVTMIVTIPKPKCDTSAAGTVTDTGGPVRMPFDGKFTVTSPFDPARKQPVLGIVRPHEGVDLALEPTGGDVLAAKDGKVKEVNPNAEGAGNNIEIDHGSGLSTRYLHLASMSVKEGQSVKAGDKIGVEGNTTGPGASISTGAHLHFEVHENGKPVNPAPWLKKQGIDLPAVDGSSTAAAVTKTPPKGSNAPKGKKASKAQPAASGGAGGGGTLPAANKDQLQNAKQTKAMSIPPTHMSAYKAAGKKYGIPWPVLAGIGMEETHHGRIQQASYAGALGDMQFTMPTWTDFGTDGNGDGQADIENPEDAIFSAANKLSKQGDTSTPEGIKKAIHLYNPGAGSSPDTSWYVNDVLFYAEDYGNGKVTIAAGGAGGAGCTKPAVAGGEAGDAGAAVTKKCETPSGSPAEKGLKPTALNGLRCGKKQAPWVETMYGIGERAGATEHDDGLAVDYMIPNYSSAASKKKATKLAAWFTTNAKALGVDYVIYDQKIWTTDKSAQGWRAMENRGDDTQNHRDHIHVSFKDAPKA